MENKITLTRGGQSRKIAMPVATSPSAGVRRVEPDEIVGWEQQRAMQPLATAQTILKTSKEDSARAFIKVCTPLSRATAAAAFVMALAGMQSPTFLWVAAYTVSAYAATWVVGWIATLLVSEVGNMLLTTWLSFLLIDRAAKRRHELRKGQQ